MFDTPNIEPAPTPPHNAAPASDTPAPVIFVDTQIAQNAAHDFSRQHPDLCANRVINTDQRGWLQAIAMSALTFVVLAPLTAFSALLTLSFLIFICCVGFRLFLTVAAALPITKPNDIIRAGTFKTAPLPRFTILLPLYHEAGAVLPLSQTISALDYPKHLLDVKFLLEADDVDTLKEIKRLKLPFLFQTLVVPKIYPFTKPKACNVGLEFARGDYTVIYDAEDRPEPNQLKKAAQDFHQARLSGDHQLACLQARLNYYNATDNWLTRLFAIEYALWFDWMLPGLRSIGAPIPLGGTSNFFRTDILKQCGGWDPYNVTEDADLGLRLARFGYRVDMLDSTTYEEANSELGNWVRQRSRWIKGHMQTWLVHMRAPNELYQSVGLVGFCAVHLFLAGGVLSVLVAPFLWGLAIASLIAPATSALITQSIPFWQAYGWALTIGNGLLIALALIAPVRRRWWHLLPFAVTMPLYWLLASLAGAKALLQLFSRPHFWEKTDHLISKTAIALRASAEKCAQKRTESQEPRL